MNRRLSFVVFYLMLVLAATTGILSVSKEILSLRTLYDGRIALVTAPSTDVSQKIRGTQNE